ncbi:glutamyl-tRNA amidotransferase chain B [Gigaspora margarita]|uniref:Glutamyl-tRNA(Gln) amidotransferase subunit B, mitochondrial n=1 Tax=Gigaspora margarita TaxID=4874 RepID=A0A8H3WZD4_GIGMA|nr:glutamyl-tRNA amidotransferase chain B [Gigaspora margarita]
MIIKTFVTTYLKKTCNERFISKIKRNVTFYQYSTHLYKSNKWETIIGLEVHAQLNSKTKLFSSSSTSFNEPVNTNVSVIDAAFPGTLPQLNTKCVELAVAASLALSGNVQLVSSFDRKQYFYPDLPPGYQITQHYAPISLGGKIFLNQLDGLEYDTMVRIKQIQLEQDTGKSIHDIVPGMTLIDLNRAGTGLIEIVTEPDMRTSKEAGLTVKKLQSILRTIGSSDGNMEEGSLRCDVNVSVHEHETPYGTRCEIKNLNSIKFLMAAIDVEIERQIKELENGNKIVQETRGFDVLKNKTFRLRTKETATDYRYMPEPDLSPLILNKDYITRISNNLPELPDDLKTRIMKQYGIPLHDVIVLMNETGGVKYFEEAVKNRNPQHVSNWITHELFGLLHARNIKFSQNPVSALQLGSVIDCVDNGDITGKVGKKIIEKMISGDSRLASIIIQDEGLRQLSDINELEKICKNVILQNPEQVIHYFCFDIYFLNLLKTLFCYCS